MDEFQNLTQIAQDFCDYFNSTFQEVGLSHAVPTNTHILIQIFHKSAVVATIWI